MVPFKHLKLGVLLSLSAVAVAVFAFAIRYFFLAEYYPHLFTQTEAAYGGDKLEERAAQARAKDDDHHSFHDEGYQDLWRYCNFLENIVIGDEAATASSEQELAKLGLKLTKVIVLIRHGARGPLRPMNSPSRPEDHKVCDLSSVKEADYSVFGRLAKQLARNAKESLKALADRLRLPADFLDFPNLDAHSDCQLARLTVLGLAQHIKLGYLLSGTYSNRLGLSLKSWKEAVAVASTEFSRTFQSAVALLYGLTSHLTVKEKRSVQEEEAKLPILGGDLNSLPRHFNLSFGAHFCGPLESSEFCGDGPFGNQCPVLEKLRDLVLDQTYDLAAHHVKPNPPNQQKRKPGAFERATWDLLSIGACHRKQTPMAPDLIAHLAQRLNSVGRALVESEHYQHSAWLKGYGFIQEPLKAILRLPDYSIPPYASRFIFEVFSSFPGEDSSKPPPAPPPRYLRLLYNGVNVTPYLVRLLPPSDETTPTSPNISLVEVERFERFVRETFSKVTGTADYGAACKGEHL
ncbi:2-phosphoxylose phosphatase 1 [Tyrophagus putrescentiae]|nr:2-phosphoxylose phosphatase 1 [Tyrophagus putrescentiae]